MGFFFFHPLHQNYVKSCNLLHMTAFCPWANSHAFSLNIIQVSFPRMCITCRQVETQAVLASAHYRCAHVSVYVNVYVYLAHTYIKWYKHQ